MQLTRSRGRGYEAVAADGASPGGGSGRRIACLGTPEPDLVDGVRTAGRQILAPGSGGGPDVALVLDPAADVAALPRDITRVAWIRDAAEAWLACPWLDDLDLVLVGPTVDGTALESVVGAPAHVERAADVPSALAEFAARPRLAIQIGPSTWADAGHWGDLPVARSVERAFR